MKNGLNVVMQEVNPRTTGIIGWIEDNVVTLIVLILAVCVLWAARGGNISKAVTIIAGLILGLAVLGMATGSTAADLGEWIANLFVGGGGE